MTATPLGIRAGVVYSYVDKDSLHVKSADDAVHIGPRPARLSYLNGPSIVDAFRIGAQKVLTSLNFVKIRSYLYGSPASAMRDMGYKRIMGAAGVPLVPGYHGSEEDIDLMKLEADKIGYPVLIKPMLGGGGKIFGDKHGNTLYLYERDCSVQRRGRKIVKEAPAVMITFYMFSSCFRIDDTQKLWQKLVMQPNITDDFRSHVSLAAVSAAKAVGYHNAGTIEFIVDSVSGRFCFMEMNIGLQCSVEHHVTEMIIGQDLVERQIRVAIRGPLPISQEQVLVKDGRKVAEGQPISVLEAMNMEHVVKAPSANYVHGLEVTAGQEVSDSSILFNIKSLDRAELMLYLDRLKGIN